MIMNSVKTLRKDGKEYIKDIFDRNKVYDQAYKSNGIEGLQAIGDDISQILIEWLHILN